MRPGVRRGGVRGRKHRAEGKATLQRHDEATTIRTKRDGRRWKVDKVEKRLKLR